MGEGEQGVRVNTRIPKPQTIPLFKCTVDLLRRTLDRHQLSLVFVDGVLVGVDVVVLL
jgi:hypothetical protein